MELINNPYFILLLAGLVAAFCYVIWKPEWIPAFLFLLLSGLGSFYGATSIEKVSLLKAVLLPLLLVGLLLSKITRKGRLPLGAYVWIGIYGISVIVSCLMNGANIHDYQASLGILLVPLVVALCPKNEKTVKYLTTAIAAWGLANLFMVMATWSGLGWARAYSAGNAIHTSHRAQGLMGHSTLMGIYFAISMNAVHVLFYQAKTRFTRVFLAILCVGMAVGLLGTLSRGALLGWVFSFLYIQYRLRGIKPSSLVVIGVFALIVVGIASFLNIDSLIFERFADMRADPSAQARMPLLAMGKKLLDINPLFGVGLGQQGRVHLETHNTYMQVLMETGIIGFLLFCGVLWKGIRGLRIRAISSNIAALTPEACYYVGLIGTMIAILVDGVSHVFDYLMPLWLILGIGFMI